MLRSWTVILLALIASSTPSLVALDTATPVPLRLQATCLGASSEVAPQRIAVRWNGSAPLGLVAWGDADGDRVRDPGEEIVAIRVIDPGYTVLELDRMPEAPLVVGPESDSPAGVAVVLAGSCQWSGDFFFADLDGTVRAFAVYNDGSGARLYVGGEFGIAGDRVVNHIARWDGTSWSPLSGPGGVAGANSNVLALAVHAGALYVGGDFMAAGGLAAFHVARWGAAGWSTLEGTNGPIRALISHDDGSGSKLYAGGSFSTAGSVAVGNIARWNGTAWESLGTSVGSVPGVTGPVSALERFTDGGSGYKLFVGGAFTSSSAGAANYIARWDGTAWSSVGDGASNGVDGAVRALEAAGGSLYVGGLFEHAGDGIVCRAIARWDGGAWSALGTGMFLATGGTGAVRALYVYDDGMYRRLYAGGEFEYAGGQPANNLAVWTGSAWTGQVGTSMAGMSLPVWALGEFGYELYAGGEFVKAGGVTARRVARWNGLPAQTWRALENRWGWGFDDAVTAWAVYDEGEGPRLFAGGFFQNVGPVAAKYLARWDGEQWSEVSDPGSGGALNWAVETLLVHDDGAGPELFVGGAFSQPARHIVAWTGSNWRLLGAPGVQGANGWVNVLASYPPGPGADLYVGGDFEEAGGVVAEGLARWDGAAWSHVYSLFSPVAFVQGGIGGLAVFDGGGGPRLYAGGIFEIAALDVHNLARWDGSSWSRVGSADPDNAVLELAVHDDGGGPALFAGGTFTHVGGVEANRVARWSGASWSALSGPAGNGVDGEVWSFGTYDDGDGDALFVGGSFTSAGGLSIGHVARWDGSTWSAVPDPSGAGLDGAVYALLSYDDGRGPALWAGGNFPAAGGRPASNAARWSCGQIFEDGFESGGVGAWDQTVGVPGGP